MRWVVYLDGLGPVRLVARGTAPMDDAARAHTEALHRRCRRRTILAMLWLLLGVGLLAAPFLMSTDPTGMLRDGPGAFLFTALVLMLPAMLVATLLKRLRALRRALKRGELERYEVVDGHPTKDWDVEVLAVEVVPPYWAIRIDGSLTHKFPRRARVGDLAPIERTTPTEDGHGRLLSEAERHELEEHRNRHQRTPWYLLTTVLIVAASIVVVSLGDRSGFAFVMGELSAVGALVGGYFFVRRLLLARRIQRDLDHGAVWIMLVDGHRIEWFPFSGLVWSENGVPCVWRVFGLPYRLRPVDSLDD